jgi:hypothetical protein
MISADRRDADPGCSPYRAVGMARWWVHSMGINCVERSPTDFPYRTLTCQNGVLAGQRRCPGNFDTEAVAQRASTALNGVKVQVNAGVEGDNLSTVKGERFLVT